MPTDIDKQILQKQQEINNKCKEDKLNPFFQQKLTQYAERLFKKPNESLIEFARRLASNSYLTANNTALTNAGKQFENIATASSELFTAQKELKALYEDKIVELNGADPVDEKKITVMEIENEATQRQQLKSLVVCLIAINQLDRCLNSHLTNDQFALLEENATALKRLLIILETKQTNFIAAFNVALEKFRDSQLAIADADLYKSLQKTPEDFNDLHTKCRNNLFAIAKIIIRNELSATYIGAKTDVTTPVEDKPKHAEVFSAIVRENGFEYTNLPQNTPAILHYTPGMDVKLSNPSIGNSLSAADFMRPKSIELTAPSGKVIKPQTIALALTWLALPAMLQASVGQKVTVDINQLDGKLTAKELMQACALITKALVENKVGVGIEFKLTDTDKVMLKDDTTGAELTGQAKTTKIAEVNQILKSLAQFNTASSTAFVSPKEIDLTGVDAFKLPADILKLVNPNKQAPATPEKTSEPSGSFRLFDPKGKPEELQNECKRQGVSFRAPLPTDIIVGGPKSK
ncbi:MAG: hypothetical protein AAGG80_01245 [Pseudomonadota bacterium]